MQEADAVGCSWMSTLDFLGAEDLMGAMGAPGDMAFLDSATLAAVCSAGQQHQQQQVPCHLPTTIGEVAPVVKRPSDDDCGGDDSDDEDAKGKPGSNKRTRCDNSTDAAKTKASKEKARRGKINDRFSELAKLIEPPGSEPKTDKPSILGDAIKYVQQMTVENHQLKQLNKFLEERVAHYERERGQTLYQQSLAIQGMRTQQPALQPQQHAMQQQQQQQPMMQVQAMQQQQQPMMQVQPMQQQQPMMHTQAMQQQQPMMQQHPIMQQQQQQQQMGPAAGNQTHSLPGQPLSGAELHDPTLPIARAPSPSQPHAPLGTRQQQQQQQQQFQAGQGQGQVTSTPQPSDGLISSDPFPQATATTGGGTLPCQPQPQPQRYTLVPLHPTGQQYPVVHQLQPHAPPQHHFFSTDLKASLSLSAEQLAAFHAHAPMQALGGVPMTGLPLMNPGAKTPHWVANMLDSAHDSLLRPPAA